MANTYTLDDKGQKVVWSGAVTDVHTNQKEVIGSTRFHGMKTYRYHKFDQGAIAAVVGKLVMFKATTQDLVTSDTSAGDTTPVAAGLLVSVPADGQFCWVQTRGPATVNLALAGSAADGDGLIAGTDGALTIQTAGSIVPPCAVASDASAKMVWMNCVM
jgi:hypothetical protein|tara:strand:+ start:2343 stop:2819 length:477 start_codon:yes stop_codon:yes gene_type:complete